MRANIKDVLTPERPTTIDMFSEAMMLGEKTTASFSVDAGALAGEHDVFLYLDRIYFLDRKLGSMSL